MRDGGGGVRITPLMRRSDLSPQSFSSYYAELLGKGFLEEARDEEGENRRISLTPKGVKYIREYGTVQEFVRQFEL